MVKKKIRLPMQESQFRTLGQEDPLERGWQPTPVFLPGESHGQRSLVGYSPQDCRVRQDRAHNSHTLLLSVSEERVLFTKEK